MRLVDVAGVDWRASGSVTRLRCQARFHDAFASPTLQLEVPSDTCTPQTLAHQFRYRTEPEVIETLKDSKF